MSINPLKNNRFDMPSLGKAAGAAKGAKAAGAGAAAGAAGAAGAAAAKGADKNTDVLKLSAIAGQAGDAPQISLGDASPSPIPKSQHADALLRASAQLSPEKRADEALKLMAMDLVEHMFQGVA